MRHFAATRPDRPLDLKLIAEEVEDLGKIERDAVFDRRRSDEKSR